jgi:hypothetical protein
MNGKLRLLPLTPRRPTCWTGGGERRSLGRHTGKATCCVKASGVQGASRKERRLASAWLLQPSLGVPSPAVPASALKPGQCRPSGWGRPRSGDLPGLPTQSGRDLGGQRGALLASGHSTRSRQGWAQGLPGDRATIAGRWRAQVKTRALRGIRDGVPWAYSQRWPALQLRSQTARSALRVPPRAALWLCMRAGASARADGRVRASGCARVRGGLQGSLASLSNQLIEPGEGSCRRRRPGRRPLLSFGQVSAPRGPPK